MQYRNVTAGARRTVRGRGKLGIGLLLALDVLAGCSKPRPDEIVAPRPRETPQSTAPGQAGESAAPSPGQRDEDAGEASDASALADASLVLDASEAGAPDTNPEPFSKRALLQAAAQCALDRYRDFGTHASTLVDVTRTWAQDGSDANARTVREAYVAAMRSFQEVEMFRVGPAARAGEPGGQDLRDQIYAFPLSSPCKVDQQLVDKAYAGAGFGTSLISGRGLAALEYLAFHAGDTNACASGIAINVNGSWAALGPAERDQRRRDYAAAVARDLDSHAAALVRAWDPAAGNFARELTEAGSEGRTFASQQAALNGLSDALMYLETEVKDWKLGWPLGLVPECLTTQCPEAVESRYAGLSVANLRANLQGFRRLFEGCSAGNGGVGFDDWLRAVGATDLEARMSRELEALESDLASLDAPLDQLLASDPARVKQTHAAVKRVTDLLKTEFVGVLNLELPRAAEGDND